MAFIYKITNDVNNKVYVGKTLNSVDDRWKEHLKDSIKPRCNKRPLYDAMNKYGQEHFSIETIEECLDEQASDREIYWIGFYKSYHNGYNATKGGDGKPYVDRNAIMIFWLCGYTPKQIKHYLGHCAGTIRKVLHSFGVTQDEIHNRVISNYGLKVEMLDLNDNLIRTFPTLREASRFIGKPQGNQHLSACCKGLRKSAYGYKWRLA